jgi:hypothetical protein
MAPSPIDIAAENKEALDMHKKFLAKFDQSMNPGQ